MAKKPNFDQSSLNRSKENKQDEFYTQLSDIENELQHYKSHFYGKTVFCNCDDPYESNFFKYFILNFEYLGLKRLITTCYSTSPVAGTQISLFDEPTPNNSKHPYKVIIDHIEDLTGNGAIDLDDIQILLKTPGVVQTLDGDGDFRSDECISLLKEADIVVTNPPFSLFREYLAQLFEYEKKFLILGNQNAITYKEVFPLIKENKLWMGYHSGHTLFAVPESYTVPEHFDLSDKTRIRGAGYKFDEKGRLWRDLGNICWWTNLDHNKRHEPMDLYKRYRKHETEYPKYDNYDAIEVSKTSDIPYDYDGAMGVPISFLDKFCPEQFEIVGLTAGRDEFECRPIKRYINPVQVNANGTTTNGSKANTRSTILYKERPEGTYYTADNADGYLQILYARILIRRKD